jgi:MFS family permease
VTAASRSRRAAARGAPPVPALASAPFRWLATGQLVSNVGDGVYAVALPWYVLSHHGGAILLGTVLAAYGIPRTCLIMVGGHLADRFGPWTVMMGADLARLGLTGLLAALAATSRPELVTLAPIAFGLGAGAGLFLPGAYAIMPRLVSGEQLQSGNALLSASTQLAVFAGPALGGIVVAAISAAAGFGLDALTFGVSALTLWRLGVTMAARARAGPALPAAAGGDRHSAGGREFWLFVRREPVVPLLMAINIAANLGSAGTSEVALPLLARTGLHAGARGYGALVAAFGIGALAGSLIATRLHQFRRPAVAAGLIFLVQAPLIACVPRAPGLVVAVAMMAGWGVLNMWANVMTQTAFQRWAPPEFIGRLSGLLLTTSYGMFPISVALAGLVVHRYGPGSFFLLSAVTIAGTLAWALSSRAFRDFGTTAATHTVLTGTGLTDAGGEASLPAVERAVVDHQGDS